MAAASTAAKNAALLALARRLREGPALQAANAQDLHAARAAGLAEAAGRPPEARPSA
jgi:glutamate-5-semialdehyde dehydrogenase